MANPNLMTGLGAAISIFLCSAGSVVASIQGGLFALENGGSWKSFIPIVQAGVLAIYGIIIAVLLCEQSNVSEQEGYQNFSAGLSVGLACLMSGVGMAAFLEKQSRMHQPMSRTSRGISDDSQQEPLLDSDAAGAVVAPISKSLILVMIFMESIGLYGLIVALMILQAHN